MSERSETILRALDEQAFRAYLQRTSPRGPAGYPGDSQRCPLARYFSETLRAHVLIKGGKLHIMRVDGTLEQHELPDWAFHVLTIVDAYDRALTGLELLKHLRAAEKVYV